MDETTTTTTTTGTGAPAGTGTPAGTGDNGNTNPTPSMDEFLKTFSVDDILKNQEIASKVQSIADARVSQALATAKTKWEAEKQAETDEATKLAKMTAAERERYEFNKEREAFNAERDKFAHEQLVLQTEKELLGAGLPNVAKYITGADADTTANNIKEISKILADWKTSVVTDVVKGTPPKDTTVTEKISIHDLKNYSASEINALYDAGKLKFD